MLKRKQPTDQPSRWPLDVGLSILIGARFVVAGVADLNVADTVINTIWAALLIGWMSLWVWLNEPALRAEEQRQRARQRRDGAPILERTVPLTRVQERFLAAQARQAEHRAAPMDDHDLAA